MNKCVLILLAAFFWSCNDSTQTGSKVDSLKQAMDTAVEKIADSVKSKSERMVEEIERKVGGMRDSTREEHR